MTREEAKELLDNLIGMIEDNHNSDYDSALKMAIADMEKQIPKKPISEDGFIKVYTCPVCNTIVGNVFGDGDTYCHICGQKISWGEEND